MTQLFVVPLENLAVVRFQGVDALPFLQGQLSNDVEKLRGEPALFAGLHDAQGRVIALLRLFAVDPDRVLAVLPKELAASVMERLAKFVLRAKVRIDFADAEWRAYGICGPDAPAASRNRLAVALSDDPPRLLVVSPRLEGLPEAEHLELSEWQALDVADGLPEVYASTSGSFVSQMLNLDVLSGIAFDKGCYTGQEIIARAHYRGRVKRRLQRFATEEPRTLTPGDKVQLADGRQVTIVRQARYGQVGSEFLAVAPFDGATTPPDSAAGGDNESARPLLATPLALPYDLPD